MLNFFRKYQWYFFLVITIVIIISFSFFGTYSTLSSNQWGEQIAFKAVNGHEVTRHDLDEMALFLATDNEDKVLFGGAWGPNFLNDGVIRKDFLETGLGQELALAYANDLRSDLDRKLEKEKKFVLYQHPQAPFLGVASAWSYFVPDMFGQFQTLRSAKDSMSPAAFNSRVKLFLGEKKMPAPTLRYVLRYQEKQYDWLQPDEKLNQIDLSLFGYHTLEDWFGPQFTRLVSEFIINAAILAEKQGYDVSKAEVLADLVRNTQISYQQNLNNPNLGVTTPEEYLSEQLRRMNMDQSRAVKVWRQVVLFRRLFQDAGATALVDPMINQNLHQFAHENVSVDLYQLPETLRLGSFEDLQSFEAYLKAVAKVNKSDPLALPNEYLSVASVEKSYPELVQKNYELEVAEADQKSLQAKISLKELWNWEVEDRNWKELVKQFPVLGPKEAKSREERLEALDSLDSNTRSLVNAFAKQAIVKAHPDWIDQALSSADKEKMEIGLRTAGGTMPFAGLDTKEKRQAFMKLLDQAVVGQDPEQGSPLYNFSGDNQTFYRITVAGRKGKPQILTFEEAVEDGTMEDVLKGQLEKYYVSIRDQNPTLYQDDKKEWRPFDSVKELVANEYFENVVNALDKVHQKLSPDQDKKTASKDKTATLRFYPHLNTIKGEMEKTSPPSHPMVKSENEEPSSLADQWKIERETVTINRENGEKKIDIEEALNLTPEAWSSLQTPRNGDLSFYQLKNRGKSDTQLAVIANQAKEAQAILGAEAQRHLMKQILQELKSKNALSLAYLKTPSDEQQPENEESME